MPGPTPTGRTTSRVRLENGRKRVLQGARVAREDWPVLLRDHHEGYISWEQFEANQRVIADNANIEPQPARQQCQWHRRAGSYGEFRRLSVGREHTTKLHD